MCKASDELIEIIDEVAGAAVSMNQGPQHYEIFIKARGLCIQKIQDSFIYRDRLTSAIEELHKISLNT